MINISTPANGQLLRLAAVFLTQAAEAIDEGCLDNVEYKIDSQSVGNVSRTQVTVGGNTSDVSPRDLRSVMEIVQDLEAGRAGFSDEQLLDELGNEEDATPPVINVAAAFAPPPPAPDVPPPPAPEPVYETVYTMTDLAKGFSREQYHVQKWTDELLIDKGLMIAEQVEVKVDAPPAAPAPMSTLAPTDSTPSSSTQGAATQPGATSIGEVDTEGLPWDARIHSGSREKVKDGTWKIKRGTPPADVVAVKAQLRQLAGNPAAVAKSVTTPPTGDQKATATPLNPCAALMRRITPAVVGGQFTQADVLAAVKSVGLNATTDLNNPANAHKIPLVEAALFGPKP